MELIIMLERRLDLFPSRFSWHGRIFEVEAVRECNTVTAPSGRCLAYDFVVRSEGKLWRVSQRLASGQWLLHGE